MTFVSTRPKLRLTQEEREYLNEISRSRTAPQRSVERAKILLAYYEKKTISQIARELGTNRPKVGTCSISCWSTSDFHELRAPKIVNMNI